MSLLIEGATVIDAVAPEPLAGRAIWIDAGRIAAIAPRNELSVPPSAQVIDANAKYVIPGLMNANVHLFPAIGVERILRHWGHYEDIILEAAQIALKNGVTTLFDTWGPRRFLIAARERINAGKTAGSRIFCAGNIIGLDGPLSADFMGAAAGTISADLVKRTDAIWAENVGRHLMWRTPEKVASEVRIYIGTRIDFVKYASNGHGGAHNSAFLAFSPRAQAAIVHEAHRAGLTAQAHATSVEGLRIAIEAGCDLIQHANMTGPVPIPETTLELMAERRTGAVIFPFTQRRFESIMAAGSDADRTLWRASDVNVRNLIRSGAPLLAANDGFVWAPEVATGPVSRRAHLAPGEDNLFDLASGHFAWFKAMQEKGCPPLEMLRAATRNIAAAYGKDRDLGSLEPGKVADLLILDKDPLESWENYRAIHAVIKDGVLIDRHALPAHPILTAGEEPIDDEASHIPFLCPACLRG